MRLNVQQVDLATVVQNALDVVGPAAAAKKITLHAAVSAGVGHVTGDPDRLQQVLWNLLSNAIKFTPAGGRAEVRVDRVESHFEVSVLDDGVGIDPAFLPWVFDPFRQADGSASRRHGGLGLGLAITRRLVELHGGTVRAESEGPGTGARFIVQLPVRAVAQPEAPADEPGSERGAEAPAALGPATLGGIDIVVVDDEADARELIRMVLAQHGGDVRLAASAADALALLAERRPDLLVADIGMPEMDGYGLIRRIRSASDPGLASVPAIALTAYGRTEDRERALGAGFQHHLAKPVLPDELVNVVARAVGRLATGR